MSHSTRRLTESEYRKALKDFQDKVGVNKELHHDTYVECTIYNKETGETVEQFQARVDNFKKICQNKVWGRKYLGWKSCEVVAQRDSAVKQTMYDV